MALLCGCSVPAEVGDQPDGGDPGLAIVPIRIEATTATFAHADGLAGMTALAAAGGVRSLTLLTGPTG